MRAVLGATMVTKAALLASVAVVALAGIIAAVVGVATDGGTGRRAEVLGAQLDASSGSSSGSSGSSSGSSGSSSGSSGSSSGSSGSSGGSSGSNDNRPTNPGRPASTGLATRFPISGSVADLVPGDQRTLTVLLTNPNPFTVSVNELTVTATGASATCGVAYLSISPLPAPVLVGGNASGTAGIPIQLVAAAPNACQGATFPLTFAAEVTRA